MIVHGLGGHHSNKAAITRATAITPGPRMLCMLVVCLLLCLQTAAAATDTPPPLVFGSDHDYPPYEYLDKDGQPAGFNVDIMRALSEVMDREIVIRLGPWTQIRKQFMETGEVDIADMFHSDARVEALDFAEPYAVMYDKLFVRRDEPDPCEFGQLTGREVIVQADSYTYDHLMLQAKGAHIITAESEPDALRLLATGAHDCALVGEVIGQYAIRAHALDNLVSVGEPWLPRQYGLVVTKGRTDLLNEINAALRTIKHDGRFDAIYKKWFLDPTHTDADWGTLLKRAGWVFGPLALIALIAVVWSLLLRQQVAARTRELRQELDEHRKTNLRLQENEALFRQLAENVREVFWLFDPHARRVIYVSPTYAEVWGRATAELYTNPAAWMDAILEEDRPVALDAYLNQIDNGGFRAEYRIQRPDGDIRWIQDRGFPVRDADGNHLRTAGIAEDVTLRKSFEQQLQTLNELLELRVQERTALLESANRDLESFSYSVSHDLRTPLRSLSGYAQILAEEYGEQLDDDARHHITRIQAASQHMSQLIDDLLRLSRISRIPVTRETTDLSAIARELTDLFSERYPECATEFAIQDTPPVEADRQLLRIALENLLGNAVKYSCRLSPARISFGASEEGGEQVFCVRDNGVGFDMAYADKLFLPFQRLHQDSDFAGTGIGLAIVQRIIHSHGGRIWASSAPDQGACFCFTLGTATLGTTPS